MDASRKNFACIRLEAFLEAAYGSSVRYLSSLEKMQGSFGMVRQISGCWLSHAAKLDVPHFCAPTKNRLGYLCFSVIVLAVGIELGYSLKMKVCANDTAVCLTLKV